MAVTEERTESGGRYVGSGTPKLRGEQFLRGRTAYIDDLVLPGLAHAAILRSPHARARIRSIDVARARERPATICVVTGADAVQHTNPIPHRMDPAAFGARTVSARPLAEEVVAYWGEPVAAVVAATRHDAEALLDLIEVDYEVLEPVLDVDEAAAPGAPRVYPWWEDNVVARFSFVDGDVDAALAAAPHTLADEIRIQRYSTQPIEPRGYVGDWDPRSGHLTFYSASQNPHTQRYALAQTLRLEEPQIRVITPDIGGGFGLKMHSHPEESLVCLLSKLAGRPVKWIEERRETLLIGGREHVHRWQVAFDDEGRLLALRDHFLANVGGLVATPGWGMARLTALTFPGGYKVPATDVEVTVVTTNKGPWNASRGYGKEATALVLEHIVDRVARHLGRDPADVRRVNFVEPHEFPYKTNSGLRIDSGDYHSALDKALAMVDYPALRAEQERLRGEGRLLGIGVSFEITPEAADFPGTLTGGFDTSTVKMDPSGAVTVLTGITTPGTGNDGAMAQITADELGVRAEDIVVVQGDTDACPFGFGNGAGRSTVMGAGATRLAARDVRAKLATVAAVMLEAGEDELEFGDGAISVRGDGRSVPVKDVAYAIYTLAFATAHMVEPPLEATRVYKPGNIDHTPDEKGRIQPYVTFSNAVHVSVVEVDRETGKVSVLRHAVVDDCGNMINPVAVKGQMVGAVGMGIGGALWEELVYDADGRLLTDRYKTYLTPRASDLPEIELEHQVTPSPYTEFGVKGAGEAGVGGAVAAVHNAVNDALAPVGALARKMPLSAPNVLALIREATKEGA